MVFLAEMAYFSKLGGGGDNKSFNSAQLRRWRGFMSFWSICCLLRSCAICVISAFVFIYQLLSRTKRDPEWMIYISIQKGRADLSSANDVLKDCLLHFAGIYTERKTENMRENHLPSITYIYCISEIFVMSFYKSLVERKTSLNRVYVRVSRIKFVSSNANNTKFKS